MNRVCSEGKEARAAGTRRQIKDALNVVVIYQHAVES